MNAYSEDLRKKIVEVVQRGTPKVQAAHAESAGLFSVKRYVATAGAGWSLASKKRLGSKPQLNEGAKRLLEANLEDSRSVRPPRCPRGASSCDRCVGRRSATPRSPGCSSVLGGPEKRSVGESERDEWLRAAWRALVAESLDTPRLVFVDECGANVSLSPLYAWSRRGRRAFAKAPRNWGANVTLLSSMSLKGMGPSLAVEGVTTRGVFEAYLEGVLAPTLRPGQVAVMDNLSAHRGSRVRELIEGRGCELFYLPPYSPDLNPIEEAFSRLKTLLRKAGARTREALVEEMGRALGAVTAQDARGFLEHRGYRSTAQLL